MLLNCHIGCVVLGLLCSLLPTRKMYKANISETMLSPIPEILIWILTEFLRDNETKSPQCLFREVRTCFELRTDDRGASKLRPRGRSAQNVIPYGRFSEWFCGTYSRQVFRTCDGTFRAHVIANIPIYLVAQSNNWNVSDQDCQVF
jgi:hypothetical protein